MKYNKIKKMLLTVFVLGFGINFAALSMTDDAASQNICDSNLKTIKEDGQKLGLESCECERATESARFQVLHMQFNHITSNIPDRNQQIVHVALAEGKLLQSYIFIKGLIALGYKKICLYVIGPEIGENRFSVFNEIIFDDENIVNFEMKKFKFSKDYIDEVKTFGAKKFNSIDLVEPWHPNIESVIKSIKTVKISPDLISIIKNDKEISKIPINSIDATSTQKDLFEIANLIDSIDKEFNDWDCMVKNLYEKTGDFSIGKYPYFLALIDNTIYQDLSQFYKLVEEIRQTRSSFIVEHIKFLSKNCI